MKTLKQLAAKLHKRMMMMTFYGKRLTFLPTNETKTIIICFDGIFSHGGLIDRIKGIISFYEVAKQLNCEFKIRFDHPFNLSQYFHPNQHDWQLGKKVRYNPFDTQIYYLMDNFHCNPVQLVKQSRAKTLLIYCNVDYSKSLFPDASDEVRAEKWRNNFNSLFKKTPFLSSALEKLPKVKHVVFHTRFTSLMGDFEDTTSKVLSEREKSDLINSLVSKISQKTQLFPDCEAFVLSDSVIFLDHIRTKTPFQVLEGTPKHVDIKNNDSNLDSHTKTLTDFFFIASSESVYLLKEHQMYLSGFSKYAAILGNKHFEVIQ